MKLAIILVFVIGSAWGKGTMDFNQAISDDVLKDIRKDDEKFKKDSFRRPASVETEKAPTIEETSKIDKNIRQIGPNRW